MDFEYFNVKYLVVKDEWMAVVTIGISNNVSFEFWEGKDQRRKAV